LLGEWIAYCTDCREELAHSNASLYVRSVGLEHKNETQHIIIVGYYL